MKDIAVGFINEETKKEYQDAKKENPKLFEFLERATDDIKKNPTGYVKIPAKLWPKEYVTKFRITNLWKYDLPNGWRLIYTIANDEVTIMAIILEWLDHKNYERRFKY